MRAGIRAGFAVGVLAESTAGPALERIHDIDAPPAPEPAELILLRGASTPEDVGLFLHGARKQLST